MSLIRPFLEFSLKLPAKKLINVVVGPQSDRLWLNLNSLFLSAVSACRPSHGRGGGTRYARDDVDGLSSEVSPSSTDSCPSAHP